MTHTQSRPAPSRTPIHSLRRRIEHPLLWLGTATWLLASPTGGCTEETTPGGRGSPGDQGGQGATNQGGAGAGAGAPCEPSPGFMPPTTVPGVPALVVTNDALRGSFELLCGVHQVTGTACQVVTVEAICAGECNDADPRSDTAHAIKDYLAAQPGLEVVVLGGDIEIVPSRQVHDTYENPFSSGYAYDETFWSDYYYSDLSEWDGNGDGVYADDGADSPDYRPELAVARIPVATPEEADSYRQKLIRYLAAFPEADMTQAVLVSNIAAEFMSIDIDGAIYLEADGRTTSLLPASMSTRKLYATTQGDPSAEIATPALQIDALEQGTSLFVHSGHASSSLLNVELDGSKPFTGQMAYDLQNETLPIYLSCGCEAGAFADDDAAGEQLVNAPNGGAIAYLGNGVIGLGLAGGMQLIDELLRYVQANDAPTLADAYLAAHAALPTSDSFTVVIPVPVVDQDSYEWTQKAVVLFGDPLIPIYKTPIPAGPTLTATATPLCDGARVSVTIGGSEPGLLRTYAGGATFEVPDALGTVTLDLPGATGRVVVGFTRPGQLPAVTEAAIGAP